MRPAAFTQFDDTVALEQPAPGPGWRAPLLRWFRVLGGMRLGLAFDLGRRSGTHRSADATTLPPPSRGQALRDAHRTLRQHMRNHPAIRQMMPHLSCIERSLAKRGSAALKRLPVGVLQRGLAQLAVLQDGDAASGEALHLRMLRFRLLEAITVRNNMPYVWGVNHDTMPGKRHDIAAGSDSLSGVSLSDIAASEISGLNSEASSSMFDDLERGSSAPLSNAPLNRRTFRY